MEIFDGIRIKKQKRTEKRPLTQEEKAAVFSADFTSIQKAFVYIIYGCGLRRGETLALERSDFETKKLNYCTNLCYQIPTISIKKIAELLGDQEKMVIEVYNHVILDKEVAQSAVEQALCI